MHLKPIYSKLQHTLNVLYFVYLHFIPDSQSKKVHAKSDLFIPKIESYRGLNQISLKKKIAICKVLSDL